MSNQVFWDKFRAHVGEERYKHTLSLFRGARTERTLTQVRNRFDAQLADRLEGMRLIGCRNESSVRQYHARMMLIMEDTFGEEQLTSGVVPPQELNRKLRSRMEALDSEFSRVRLCHPAYDGFVCFCDERPVREHRFGPSIASAPLQHLCVWQD